VRVIFAQVRGVDTIAELRAARIAIFDVAIGEGGFTDDCTEKADAGNLRIRNYAPSTVRCYIRAVAEFAKYFDKSPDLLGPEEIRQWQLYLLNEKRVKLSTYIQVICALRFFYATP